MNPHCFLKMRDIPRKISGALKIRHKMIGISIVLVLMVGIVSISGYHISLNEYNDLLYRQTSTALSLFSQQVRLGMSAVEDISNRTVVNSEIQSNLLLLSLPFNNEIDMFNARQNIVGELYKSLTPDILCVTILLENGDSVLSGVDSSPEYAHVIEHGKQIGRQNAGAGEWITNDRNDGSALFVREIRKTEAPGFLESLGFLFFRVNFDRIVNRPGNNVNLSGKHTLVISDNDGNLFYSTNVLQPADLEKIQAAKGKEYHIQEIGGEMLFVSHIGINTTNPAINIIAGLKYDDIFRSITQTRLSTLLSIILAIIIAVAAAGVAVRRINNQFVLLVKKINRFKSGNLALQKDGEAYGSDEFGLLNRYFDESAVELKTMIDDNYVKQLLLTQAQLKNLKQQIHPHFLYNTLETVRCLAKQCGEEYIPVVVDALSALLRDSMAEKEDAVALGAELKMLENYITIQKIRYADRLDIAFDIDPRTLNAKIPIMSIQPLVENAIAYSLEESVDGCKIIISSRIEGDEIVISVKNSGSQIDEDILYKLENNIVRANGQGIGLSNINARLRILFGERYGLRFTNEEDSVTVSLHLPIASFDGAALEIT